MRSLFCLPLLALPLAAAKQMNLARAPAPTPAPDPHVVARKIAERQIVDSAICGWVSGILSKQAII